MRSAAWAGSARGGFLRSLGLVHLIMTFSQSVRGGFFHSKVYLSMGDGRHPCCFKLSGSKPASAATLISQALVATLVSQALVATLVSQAMVVMVANLASA